MQLYQILPLQLSVRKFEEAAPIADKPQSNGILKESETLNF
jgi:hypothetical protein